MVWGCVKHSPGCAHCYSEALALRYQRGKLFNARNMEELEPFLDEKELHEMLHRKTCDGVKVSGSRCFVGDMTDVFGGWVPDEMLDRLFAVFALRPDVTWQVLTKRAERMAAYFSETWQVPPIEYEGKRYAGGTEDREDHVKEAARNMLLGSLGDDDRFWRDDGNSIVTHAPWPLANCWLGVSVEDQQRSDERIPWLLKTPAAVRFLSCEPLLSAVDLSRWLQFQGPEWRYSDDSDSSGRPPIDWVIVGGESGPQARPMHPDWVRSLRDQCQAAGVPFFFKQWGEWAPADEHPLTAVGQRQTVRCVKPEGGDRIIRGDGRFSGDGPCEGDKWMALVGKKKAGRQLDGRQWEAFPRVEVPA